MSPTLSIFFFNLFTFVLCCCVKDYTVPEPKLELLYPRGFSVKIPHSDGISLFAFHGKVNEDMEHLEAGKFSKDICKRSGDYWIFEDRHTALNVGDKINFWLFVIKDSRGYRYDDGQFVVKDDTPYRLDGTVQEAKTSPSSTDNEQTTKANEPSSTKSPIAAVGCNSAIRNATETILKLRTEVNSLKDINEILREISEKHPESTRTLKVEGRIPANEDALDTVKGIIRQKLLLSIEIVKARRNGDGSISFETGSLDDKVEIVRAAKEKLRHSRIYLSY